uniref:BTB domain-containing protein n=1 Tax=Trichobilharzia regenti TaxID=157069 RepID=A0AA85KIG0_TRIRE|nr:unnamed protein product [Trichobilharzia regenti]
MSDINGRFINPMGPNDLCQKLFQQQQDKISECDFLLECDTHSQVVHRCLLRAVSPTIDQLCSEECINSDSNHTDSDPNDFHSDDDDDYHENDINQDSDKSHQIRQVKNSFHLGNIPANTLEAIVNYIYKSEILINDTNALELFNACSLLKIQFIQDACTDYLKASLNDNNCLLIMKNFNTNNSNEDNKLVNECIKYAAKHFDMLEKDEMLNATPDELLRMLKHTEFCIQDEWKLIEFIHSWINHDQTNRYSYADQLTKQIRFQLLDTEKLLEILENLEWAIFHQCVKKALIELGQLSRQSAIAKWERKSDLPKDAELNSSPPPRVASSLKTCSNTKTTEMLSDTTLVCFGGRLSDKRFTMSITCFEISQLTLPVNQLSLDEQEFVECDEILSDDIIRESFTFPYLKQFIVPNLQQMPSMRKGFGAVSLENRIYLFGGRPKTSLQSGEIYDISEESWLEGPKLNVGRSWFCLTECDGLIFAVGGVGDDAGPILSSVEMLDPRVNKWQLLSPMIRPRFGFGICPTKKGMAVVGGVDEQTVELYDIKSGKWQPLAKMEEAREAPSVFAYDDSIYICGGANKAGCLNRTNIFSLKTGEWSQGKSMILHRAFTATRIWKEFVFLIGGRNNTEPSNLIQAYNLKTNEWAVLPQTLPYYVSSCCAITTNVL